MSNQFLYKPICDRCGGSLVGKSRIMSWFTEETICSAICHEEENELKSRLEASGQDPRNFEGCGYIPKVSNSAKFIEKE